MGASAAGYPLRVEAVADEDGVWQVMAHNRGSSPIYVQLELKKTENIRQGGAGRSGGRVLEAGAREVMAEAIPIEPTEKVNFNWELKWVFGRGTNKGNHDGLYRPPFPGDLTFDTTNTATEHPARERYAVDILMPAGTPVIAARSGWVMDVAGEEGGDRVEDGLTPAYIDQKDVQRMGAYVRIVHDDGTWAEYSNLKEGSIKVTPGVTVEAGTQIGLSGEQFGSEPHLTFAVMKALPGFMQPESLPIKMEMAGRGVIAVVAGNVIGASLSVSPGAQVTKADPLVIAQVEKGTVSELAGVFAIRQRLVKDPTLALGLGGLLLAGVIGFGWRYAKRKKGPLSFAEWYKTWIKKPQAVEEIKPPTAHESEEKEFAAARMQESLRPQPGYLIAEWEMGVYGALGLAMKPGYQVFPKMSMNRLFSRPSEWLVWKDAHAQMRGESIDFAVVRLRDGKIVAAVDIERSVVKQDWSTKVDEMRAELLRNAAVKQVVITGEEGPDELQKLLSDVVKDDGLGARGIKLAA
jgi:hypothetical protein